MHLSGFHVVEHRGDDGIWIDVNYFNEVDIKISQFILRQLGPKGGNQAYILKKWIEKIFDDFPDDDTKKNPNYKPKS